MKPEFLCQTEEAFGCRQYPILHLNTEDRFLFREEGIGPANLEYFLSMYFQRQGYRVAQYAPSQGVREISSSCSANGRGSSKGQRQEQSSISALPEGQAEVSGLQGLSDPVQVFNGLSRLLRQPKERWLVLVKYPEHLAPGQQAGGGRSQDGNTVAEILHTLALDDAIAAGASRLVLICYGILPEDLLVRSRGFRLVEVGLPGLEARQDFIATLDRVAADPASGLGRRHEGMSAENLAVLSSGMPLSGIEGLYRASAFQGTPMTREQVRAVKSRAIRNLGRDLVEVSEPQSGFEGVAGMQAFKEYFYDLIPQIKAGKPGAPQAILLQGVPGVGKSHVADALAKELGIPKVETRSIRAPFVGQSEANLDHVIRIIEQLAPVVFLWDEIDQVLGQRGTGASGDSGTSERMLARIFTWLGSQKQRGRILFVGCTNRPDLLDAALLDRFGVSVPFLRPGRDDIQEMVTLFLARFQRKLAGVSVLEVASLLHGLTPSGRDLQEIIITAGLMADKDAGKMDAAITKAHFQRAARDQIGRENPLEMEFIELTALALTSRQSLLPWNDGQGLRKGGEIPERFLATGVVGQDGLIDKARLHEVLGRVRQLRLQQRMAA